MEVMEHTIGTGSFVRLVPLFNTMSQNFFIYHDFGIPSATYGGCNALILGHPNWDPSNVQLG